MVINKKTEVNTLVLGGIITSRNKYSDRGQVLLIELFEEHYLSHCIYEAASERGVIHQLMHSDAWRLIAGLQCSFVGQFMRFIEQLGVLNSNIAIIDTNNSTNNNNNNNRNSKSGPSPSSTSSSSTSAQQQQQQQQQGGNAGAWEQLLRGSIEHLTILWSIDTLRACDRYIPFAIRASKDKDKEKEKSQSVEAKRIIVGNGSSTTHQSSSSSSTTHVISPPITPSSSSIHDPSRFFQLLDIAEHHPEVVSEWTLFSFYVEDALKQAR